MDMFSILGDNFYDQTGECPHTISAIVYSGPPARPELPAPGSESPLPKALSFAPGWPPPSLTGSLLT